MVSEQCYMLLPIQQKKTCGQVEGRSPAGKAVGLGTLPLMGKENRIENFRFKPKRTGKAREGLGENEKPGQTPAYVYKASYCWAEPVSHILLKLTDDTQLNSRGQKARRVLSTRVGIP